MAATVLKIISSEPAPLPARCSEEAMELPSSSQRRHSSLAQVIEVVRLCLLKDPSKRPSAKARAQSFALLGALSSFVFLESCCQKQNATGAALSSCSEAFWRRDHSAVTLECKFTCVHTRVHAYSPQKSPRGKKCVKCQCSIVLRESQEPVLDGRLDATESDLGSTWGQAIEDCRCKILQCVLN